MDIFFSHFIHHFQNWTRAPSRQMHEEMEQYLYQKQLEAIKQSGPKIV